MKLNVYRWHTVNWKPYFNAVDMVEDDLKTHAGRYYEAVWLGVVVVLEYPTKTRHKAWGWPS